MSPKTAAALGIKIDSANNNLIDLPNTDVAPARDDPAHPRCRPDDRVPDGQGHHARRPQHGTARPHRARPGRRDADHRARLGPHRAAPDQGRPRRRHRRRCASPRAPVSTSTSFAPRPRPASSPASKSRRSTRLIRWPSRRSTTRWKAAASCAKPRSINITTTPPSCRKSASTRTSPQGETKGYQNYESGYDNPPLNSKRPISPTARPGAWSSTSTPASAAAPASSPARPRTTSPSSANSRSSAVAKCTGFATTAISPATIRRRPTRPATRCRIPITSTIRRCSSSRWPASSARTRRASRSARSTPPSTTRKASTSWPTTAASARAIAPTIAPTRCAGSISSTTTTARSRT